MLGFDVFCANIFYVHSKQSVLLMSTVASFAVEAVAALQHLRPHPINKFLSPYVLCLYARQLAWIPVEYQTRTVKVRGE